MIVYVPASPITHLRSTSPTAISLYWAASELSLLSMNIVFSTVPVGVAFSVDARNHAPFQSLFSLSFPKKST